METRDSLVAMIRARLTDDDLRHIAEMSYTMGKCDGLDFPEKRHVNPFTREEMEKVVAE